MKRLLLCLIACLAFAFPAYAQSTATATWNQSEAAGVASTFNYQLQVDATTPQVLQPNCVAAVAPATGSVCTSAFTLTNPSAIHRYVLTASNAFGQGILSLGPGAVPGTGGFKVIVQVTITQPGAD